MNTSAIELMNDLSVADGDRELLSDTHGLYRSHIFEIHSSVNPLVSAAAPLLTMATQLREQRQPPELIPLHSALCYEIKVFENKARTVGYRSSVILAGRYFLCVLIDEIILNTTWGAHSRWEQQNLLQTFQREAIGDERFFVILERSCEDPTLHIDLLELGYFCLSLGYQGRYRKKNNGAQELGLILDKLYHFISENRGERTKRLMIAPNIIESTATPQRTLPLWSLALITFAALISIYIPYHIKLDHITAPIASSLQTLVPTASTVDE